MKILLLSELYLPIINGVVTSTSTLCKALEDEGHEVKVLSLANKQLIKENTFYNEAFSLEAIYPNAFATLKLDKQIYKEIITWNPDILHTQSEFSTMLFAKKIAKKLNIPIVHTYHTSYEDYVHYLFLPKILGKKLVASLLKKLLKNVTHIITPTKKIRKMLKLYGIKNTISVIPTGIELDFPILAQNKKNKLKQELGISEEKKILLFLGRIAKEKNIESLIEYIAQIKNENYFLLIAGDGPHRQELEKKAKELKIQERVLFAGMIPREKVYTYYQLADVFVSASTSETQGLTYIEALANARPLLCQYDTCLDNVLIPHKNGYFFKNFEEFENRANELFEESRYVKMQTFAKESVQHLSKKNFAKSVLDVYERAIKKKKSA